MREKRLTLSLLSKRITSALIHSAKSHPIFLPTNHQAKSFLSSTLQNETNTSNQIQISDKKLPKITDSIQPLYEDKFFTLSKEEQKYILDNQAEIDRITQNLSDRYRRSRIPDNIRINDTNMVEFYLYPDGSISDLRFLKNSQLSILNDTTRGVIELAYSKYPRPQQKTLIRYQVCYDLTGY